MVIYEKVEKEENKGTSVCETVVVKSDVQKAVEIILGIEQPEENEPAKAMGKRKAAESEIILKARNLRIMLDTIAEGTNGAETDTAEYTDNRSEK